MEKYYLPIELDAQELEIMENLVRSNPSDAYIYYIYSKIFKFIGNLEDVIEKFKRVIKLDEKSESKYLTIMSHVNIGKIYRELGDPILAHANFEKAMDFATEENRVDLYNKINQRYL